jgi:hypothetical protein
MEFGVVIMVILGFTALGLVAAAFGADTRDGYVDDWRHRAW